MINQFSDARLAAILSIRRYDHYGEPIRIGGLYDAHKLMEIIRINNARMMALRADNWKIYIKKLDQYLDWFSIE